MIAAGIFIILIKAFAVQWSYNLIWPKLVRNNGNNSQNNCTGTCAFFRGNSQISGSNSASRNSTAFAGDFILDTNAHGGSAQTYKYRMHKIYGGNRSNNQQAHLRNASLTVIEVL